MKLNCFYGRRLAYTIAIRNGALPSITTWITKMMFKTTNVDYEIKPVKWGITEEAAEFRRYPRQGGEEFSTGLKNL